MITSSIDRLKIVLTILFRKQVFLFHLIQNIYQGTTFQNSKIVNLFIIPCKQKLNLKDFFRLLTILILFQNQFVQSVCTPNNKICENIFTNAENSNTYNKQTVQNITSVTECQAGTSNSAILANLDNELWQPDQKNKCFCTWKSGTTNHETFMYLRTVITGIKTIVFTSIPETNATSLLVKYAVSNTPSATSNTWITACSANCFLGTNDFTAAPLTIGALYWTFPPLTVIGICEIWAYQYQNYIPGSLITAFLPGFDAKSVNFASYATNNNFVVLKDHIDSYFIAGAQHTCIRNQKSVSNYLAYIVVDFTQNMWIHEILQMSGKSNYVNIYLINPSSNLMTQSAIALVATAKTLTNSDIINYPGNEVKLISSTNNIRSIPCDATECKNWGVTRMIFAPISNPQNDFFTCGMAVMAQPTNCTSLCYNPILMQLNICPANLTIAQASFNTSQNFLFPNDTSKLDLTCNPVSPICNQNFAHNLKCIDCNTCNNTVNCSGTACSTNYTSPPFSYTISQTFSPYNITIYDDQTQIINHFCKIDVNMTSIRNISQTNQSTCGVKITVNPCPAPSPAQCDLTKLGILNSSSCPSGLIVSYGSTIQSNLIGFRFPDSISTQCYTAAAPYVCDLPQSHVLQCQTCTDSSFASCTSTYNLASILPYNVYLNQTTKKYQLNITGTQSGVFQRCRINATIFGGLQMQQSSCSFTIQGICGYCNKTYFTQSNVPNFTLPIAIGATGQRRPFLAFNDTVSTCGTLCVNQKYSIYCLDNNGNFQTISTVLSGVTNTFNTASYPNFSLEIKTSKQSLNGQSFTCMLNVISLAVGSNATMNSTQNFTLSFSLCSNQTESCPLDTWSPNPTTWVKPTNILVYLDGINQTATFDYSNVATKLSLICGISNYCGTLQYYFQQVTDNLPVQITGATVYPTVDDPLTKTLSITVSSINISSISITKVKVFVILNQGSLWIGQPLNYSLSYFNVTIADPCNYTAPCQYAIITPSNQIFDPMILSANNIALIQTFTKSSEQISLMCINVTCNLAYKLVFSSNLTDLPNDLAYTNYSINNDLQVVVMTQNIAYLGVWSVKIKSMTSWNNVYGNPFNITIICPQNCSQSVFMKSNVPKFQISNPIPIGLFGQIQTFEAFSDVFSLCGNSICKLQSYEIFCLDISNQTGPPYIGSFESLPSDINVTFQDLQNSTYNLFIQTQDKNKQLKIYNCLLRGSLLYNQTISQPMNSTQTFNLAFKATLCSQTLEKLILQPKTLLIDQNYIWGESSGEMFISAFEITPQQNLCIAEDIFYSIKVESSKGGSTSFIAFNQQSLSFNWFDGKIRAEEQFKITINAQIQGLNARGSTTFKLLVEPPITSVNASSNLIINPFDEQLNAQNLTQVQNKPPNASIGKVSKEGIFQIQFSDKMFFPQDLNTFRWTNLTSDKLPPLQLSILASEPDNAKNLNFEYKIINSTENRLILQIYFNNPLFVTRQIEDPDILQVDMIPEFFFSITGLKLSKNTTRLQSNLPFMNNLNDIKVVSVSKSASFQTGQTVGVNIFLFFFLQQVWDLIETQQIIILLPLFNMRLPGNAAIVFNKLTQITQVDVIPVGLFYEKNFDYKKTEPISTNFLSIGYDTSNFMFNLGSLIIAIIWIPLLTIMITILCAFNRCRQTKIYLSIKRSLFFKYPIKLMFDQCSSLILCSFMSITNVSLIPQFIQLQFDTKFDQFSSTLAIIICSIVLSCPIFFVTILYFKFQKLDQENIKNQIGYLYWDLKLASGRSVILEPFIYLTRRIILSAICVFQNSIICQIITMQLLCLLHGIHLGLSSPYEEPFKYRMEYFNEFILISILYCIMCFTDFVNDPIQQYNMGYVCSTLIGLHIFVNLVIIYKKYFHTLRMKWRRFKMLRAYKKRIRVEKQAQKEANEIKFDIKNRQEIPMNQWDKLGKVQEKAPEETKNGKSKESKVESQNQIIQENFPVQPQINSDTKIDLEKQKQPDKTMEMLEKEVKTKSTKAIDQDSFEKALDDIEKGQQNNKDISIEENLDSNQMFIQKSQQFIRKQQELERRQQMKYFNMIGNDNQLQIVEQNRLAEFNLTQKYKISEEKAQARNEQQEEIRLENNRKFKEYMEIRQLEQELKSLQKSKLTEQILKEQEYLFDHQPQKKQQQIQNSRAFRK